jgi:predicted GNAT family acetyltransferase
VQDLLANYPAAMPRALHGITFTTASAGLDWAGMKADLAIDEFDNGRTPDQLRRSFENSFAVAYALDGDRCIAMARLLADGVCNAYLVDVWTFTPYRRRGIASELIRRLLVTVPGHHVGLFTEYAPELYRSLGFDEEHIGMSRVIGEWLKPG